VTFRRRKPSSPDASEAVTALAARVEDIAASLAQARADLATFRADAMAGIAAAVEDEPAVRRLLEAARNDESYERPYTVDTPLVSVCIPTYRNWQGLVERAIPSALAQDHPAIEVVVVGDSAPPETAEAIAALGDDRVRYVNLPMRGFYPEEEIKRWYVAGTPPMNHALHLARGEWIAILNDDDAFRPHHVSTLLATARVQRAEVAYGKLVCLDPEGGEQVLGSFPPVFPFGWQPALQHRAMRMYEFELAAAAFDEPGDWNRTRRMLRTGVRFAFVDEILVDYYPSRLWTTGR
jgi:hypothetical protein